MLTSCQAPQVRGIGHAGADCQLCRGALPGRTLLQLTGHLSKKDLILPVLLALPGQEAALLLHSWVTRSAARRKALAMLKLVAAAAIWDCLT